MNSKNRSWVLVLGVLLVVMVLTTLAFILKNTHQYDEINQSINIYGISLNDSEEKTLDIIEFEGVHANCVYGYEYAFEDIQLNVGFRSDNKKLRRITLRSTEGQAFNVKVGMTISQGGAILLENGFSKGQSSYRYKQGDLEFLLLSSDGLTVDGIQVEIMDASYIKKVMSL